MIRQESMMAQAEPATAAFRMRGWFGIAILVPVGIATLLSHPMIERDSLLDILTDDLAWLVFLAGGVMRMWATLYLGGRKGATVVCEGPYSIVRNPLYVGSFLLGLSLGIFMKSFAFSLAVTVVGLLYAQYTIPSEERFLAANLGDPYRAYLARVPRLIPRFSGYHTPSVITVDVPALRREASKSIGWLLFPLIGGLLAHLRYLPWWPALFPMP